MSLVPRSARLVGLGLAAVVAFVGIGAVPASAVGTSPPAPSASSTGSRTPAATPAPSASSTLKASPTPKAPAVPSQAPTASASPTSSPQSTSSAPGATTRVAPASRVSISGRLIFDRRTTAAQRAAISISAYLVRGGDKRGTVAYDPKTGIFRISGLAPDEYTLSSRMALPSGGSFAPEHDWMFVDAREKSVSGVVLDWSTARGGIRSELIVFEENVAMRGVQLFARNTKTNTDTAFVLFGGGLGGIYADVVLPTGTTVTVRAQYTDGRVVYYDGTSTGSPDPARAVAVTAGLWDWSQVTLDWAAAALPTLSASTPTITGTARVGALLAAVPGSWTKGTTFRYQWFADGRAISGATASTFRPTAAHQGKKLSVRVTGSLARHTSVSKTSKRTVAVVAGILSGTTPKISGVARVGRKLTAVPGTWTSGTTLSYQWLADGKAIRGATAATFTPTSTQRGARLTVRVTGAKAGYAGKSATSAATVAVER